MEEYLSSLLPSLVRKGVFGSGEFVSFSREESSEVAFQFASQIAFFRVNLSQDSGGANAIPIVVKVQLENSVLREARDSKTLFYNEVSMYNEVLPYLNKDGTLSYPKLYFGLATDGKDCEKDILIMENLKESGYKLCPDRVFMDDDHITVGIKKLAELHAWSFSTKHRDKEGFFNVSSKLRECVMENSDQFDMEEFMYKAMEKGVEVFIKDGIEVELFTRFLAAVKPVVEVARLFCAAEEPFGVVIHGDYCKNNVFYRYDADGRAAGAAFFDLQSSRYGSPAVDLAFFLYMHTSEQARSTDLWDHLLRLYWAEVRDRSSTPDLPAFPQFREHFASRAAYGYLHCSFFLPRMLEEGPFQPEVILRASGPERLRLLLDVGGEKGRAAVRSVLQHLLDMGYIHKFLEYYDRNRHKYISAYRE